MKKLVISAAAVVALGATVIGAKTARAEAWVSSGWNYVSGHYTNVTIVGGFTTTVDINDSVAVAATMSVANTGLITNALFTNGTGNCQGTGGHSCPTSHVALTLCNDNTFITGPVELDYRTDLSQLGTISYTGTPPTAFGQGRWTPTWGRVGDVTGYCEDLTNAVMIAGGVWIYNYGP